ncbi:MAG: peroxiredoxin-like family protein [Cyclobacteriaceae bacterium]
MSKVKTLPSYGNELETLRTNLGNMLPADKLAVFDKDAVELGAAHRNILKQKKGDTAPDFRLTNATGEPVSLSELLRHGKVVMVFYRGTWCPYCNLQLNIYKGVLPRLTEARAQLVAISPQTPDESLTRKEKNELPYQVLSDPGNVVARQFTTVFKNGEAPLQAMEELGIDFGTHYADDSMELPVPAVFIIGTDRTVLFAETSGGDYRNRVEPEIILNALNA